MTTHNDAVRREQYAQCITESQARPCLCPVCDSDRTSPRYRFSSHQAAQHFVLSEGSAYRHEELAAHISELWEGRFCYLHQCLNCGFGFAEPYVAGDITFYDLAYERPTYPADRWEYGRTLRDLAEADFYGKRVLEVGAGIGAFIEKIISHNHCSRWNITALEYGAEAIGALCRKGLIVFRAEVYHAQLEPGFDAIFMFQVLEHMDKLNELFDRLSHLLRPGGKLFVSVPNADRIHFSEMNGSLLDMPPNHIGRWTRAALEIMGSRHGLALDLFEVEPFSLGEFIKQDMAFSYLRHSQKQGTIANWSRSLRSKPYGKLLGSAVAAAMSLRRINVWRRAADTKGLGASVWAKFTK